MAWEDLNETFDYIRNGNKIATFGLARKIKLWDHGIISCWNGMRGVWEVMDKRTKKIDGCEDMVEVRENLVKMEKITASIRKWTDKIPTLRMVCDEWDKAIEQILPASQNQMDASDNEYSENSSNENEHFWF